METVREARPKRGGLPFLHRRDTPAPDWLSYKPGEGMTLFYNTKWDLGIIIVNNTE